MSQDDRVPSKNNPSKRAGVLKSPPAPNLAGRVRARLGPRHPGRRPGWKAVAVPLLLVLLVVFRVPPVRAGLVEFFQVGVVRIFRIAPTASPPAPGVVPGSLLNLAGRTTLEDARKRAGFPILLPAYPADLGAPDRVYYQREAEMVILVWLEPADPQKVRLSLHAIGSGSFIVQKMRPQVVQETSVGGQYALWTTGPYMVEVSGNDYAMLRQVEGHTLIWAAGQITYRLETGLTLEEALKMAESLH